MTNTINPKWNEIILASERAIVFDNEKLTFQGLEQDSNKVAQILSNIEKGIKVIRRGDKKDPAPLTDNAEANTSLKQPIPYVLIKRGDELFVYERLEGGGEAGLHGKLSSSFGGHMNPEDVETFEEEIMINLERELEEELNIQAKSKQLNFIGLINDDNDPVGLVHIGILALLELPLDAEVSVRETEQIRGFWTTVEELKQPETYKRLESWSQIAINIL